MSKVGRRGFRRKIYIVCEEGPILSVVPHHTVDTRGASHPSIYLRFEGPARVSIAQSKTSPSLSGEEPYQAQLAKCLEELALEVDERQSALYDSEMSTARSPNCIVLPIL
ncbi:hypothetical protein ACKLNR_002027 [Fusarium oxysporum f. sp. zingiberi]